MALFFPEDFLERDGRFRALMPGDFVPILYVTSEHDILCADCVSDNAGTDDPDWIAVGYQLHYEGPPETCDGCGKEIASMYGEPEP